MEYTSWMEILYYSMLETIGRSVLYAFPNYFEKVERMS